MAKLESGSKSGMVSNRLTPFLFMIAVDTLSHMLSKGTDKGTLEGLRVGDDRLEISHLQFCKLYNTFPLLRPCEVLYVLTILHISESVLGQQINLSKKDFSSLNVED